MPHLPIPIIFLLSILLLNKQVLAQSKSLDTPTPSFINCDNRVSQFDTQYPNGNPGPKDNTIDFFEVNLYTNNYLCAFDFNCDLHLPLTADGALYSNANNILDFDEVIFVINNYQCHTENPTPTVQPTFTPPSVIYTNNDYTDYYTAVELHNNYLYIVNNDYNQSYLSVFDVSNKSDIHLVNTILLPSGGWDLEIDRQNQLLYVALSSSGIYVYQIDNLPYLTHITTLPFHSTEIKLLKEKNLILSSTGNALYAIDLTDTSNYDIIELDRYQGEGCIGKYDILHQQYISLHRINGLCWPFTDFSNYLIEVTNNSLPQITYLKTLNNISGHTVFSGNIGFLAKLSEPGKYYNYSSPLQPQLINTFPFAQGDEVGIWDSDLLVYNRHNDGIFHYYDISNPTEPIPLAINQPLSNANSIANLPIAWDDRTIADDQYIYIANGREGWMIAEYKFIPHH